MKRKRDWNPLSGESIDGPVVLRRRSREGADMDITPMIDIVFLLLIFFLVSTSISQQSMVELAASRTGVGVNDREATVITLLEQGTLTRVYLGDGSNSVPLPADEAAQETEILTAIEAGLRDGRSQVILKADKDIEFDEVHRVAGIVGLVDGVRLNFAVKEK